MAALWKFLLVIKLLRSLLLHCVCMIADTAQETHWLCNALTSMTLYMISVSTQQVLCSLTVGLLVISLTEHIFGNIGSYPWASYLICGNAKCEVIFISILLQFSICIVCPDPVGSEPGELLLSLNKNLLRSLEGEGTSPNPSVHLALRLSTHHNLGMESDHLNALKTYLHNDIER